MLNISGFIPHHALYRSEKTALVFENSRFTYREFNAGINKLANALSSFGIRKGNKIATFLPNSAELPEIYWAAARLGAVVVPLSPLMRGQGLINLLKDSESTLIITNKEQASYLDAIRKDLKLIPQENFWLVDSTIYRGYQSYHYLKAQQNAEEAPHVWVSEDDPYNIMYTSGTTGLPKGIVLTHYIRSMYAILFSNYLRIQPESIILHSGSIVFNGSFLTLMPAFFCGCTYVLQSHFDPAETIEIIQKEKVTHIVMVPSQIIQLLKFKEFHKKNLPSLEMLLTVGAPLHLEFKQELIRRMPDVLFELYGLTEGLVTILDKTEFLEKMGSVGKVPPFFQIKILNEAEEELPVGEIGEIVGKGPILMKEYYKNSKKTSEAVKNGWLFTGDLGYLDADGFLYLAGRKKELIISGGVNVYPGDIEELILKHPAVADAAVFGIEEATWGEAPVAALILKENKPAEPDSYKEWINRNVEARYQKVHDVFLLEEFPKNVAGKVLKSDLKEMYLKNIESKSNKQNG